MNWQQNIEWMKNADKDKERLKLQTDIEIEQYINDCELSYNRTTEEHIKLFEEKKYEGDVNERNWYRYSIYLKRKKGD